jgi:hypothetical protein
VQGGASADLYPSQFHYHRKSWNASPPKSVSIPECHRCIYDWFSRGLCSSAPRTRLLPGQKELSTLHSVVTSLISEPRSSRLVHDCACASEVLDCPSWRWQSYSCFSYPSSAQALRRGYILAYESRTMQFRCLPLAPELLPVRIPYTMLQVLLLIHLTDPSSFVRTVNTFRLD